MLPAEAATILRGLALLGNAETDAILPGAIITANKSIILTRGAFFISHLPRSHKSKPSSINTQITKAGKN
jgi:hypothetical protein